MINKIKELQNKGLSYRGIAKKLDISLGMVQRLDKKSVSELGEIEELNPSVSDKIDTVETIKADTPEKIDTVTDTDLTEIPEKVRIRYPNLLIEDYKPEDYNRLGVKKLRKSDYTPKELKIFPDAPYFNDE